MATRKKTRKRKPAKKAAKKAPKVCRRVPAGYKLKLVRKTKRRRTKKK
jgi:hypothetical protein